MIARAWRVRDALGFCAAEYASGVIAKRRKKKAPPKKKSPPPKPRAKSQKTVVREIRKKVEEKLAHDVEKAGLGDYIKLIALEKELTGETGVREMTVTWVDPSEADEK